MKLGWCPQLLNTRFMGIIQNLHAVSVALCCLFYRITGITELPNTLAGPVSLPITVELCTSSVQDQNLQLCIPQFYHYQQPELLVKSRFRYVFLVVLYLLFYLFNFNPYYYYNVYNYNYLYTFIFTPILCCYCIVIYNEEIVSYPGLTLGGAANS